LVNRAFYANRQTWLPSIVTLGLFGLSWPFYGWLESMGTIRIPILAAVTTFFQWLILAIWWWKQNPGVSVRPILVSSLRIVVALAISGIPAWWCVHLGLFSQTSKALLFFALSVHAVGMIVVAWILMAILGESNARQWLGQLATKLKLKKRLT
jgi:hypothetical protein